MVMDGEYKSCTSSDLEVDLKLCERKVDTFLNFHAIFMALLSQLNAVFEIYTSHALEGSEQNPFRYKVNQGTVQKQNTKSVK